MENVFRLLRICNDMSTREVANNLGVTTQYVNQIERGEKYPSKTVLDSYANLFKIKVSTLNYFEEENQENKYDYQGMLLKILQTISNK